LINLENEHAKYKGNDGEMGIKGKVRLFAKTTYSHNQKIYNSTTGNGQICNENKIALKCRRTRLCVVKVRNIPRRGWH